MNFSSKATCTSSDILIYSLSLPESNLKSGIMALTCATVADESLNVTRVSHSNESYWAALSSGAVYNAAQVFLTCESVAEILKCVHSNESYWAALSSGAVYNAAQVFLTCESVDEILKCDHSNESYRAVLSCGAVYYAVQGDSNFWVCGWNPKVCPFKWKLLSSTFLWCCLLCCTSWF